VGECFFWYQLTRVFPDKIHRAVKRVCVCVCVLFSFLTDQTLIVPSQSGSLKLGIKDICLYVYTCLQCFDAVGWVSGRASGPARSPPIDNI